MLRSRFLGSAAGAMIAFAFVVSPALSQSTTDNNRSRDNGYADDASAGTAPADGQSDSGPQDSTPAERARTEELNRTHRDGMNSSPAVLNGQQPGGLERAEDTDQKRSDAYRDRLSRYNNQMDRYHEQRSDYERNMARYNQREWRFHNYPSDISSGYEADGLRSVALMSDAGRLVGLPVQGPNGWVGRIRAVHLGMSGRPGRVEIALNRRFAVWIQADRLRFDRDNRVVFTDLSQQDVWGMPGTSVQTVDYR